MQEHQRAAKAKTAAEEAQAKQAAKNKLSEQDVIVKHQRLNIDHKTDAVKQVTAQQCQLGSAALTLWQMLRHNAK